MPTSYLHSVLRHTQLVVLATVVCCASDAVADGSAQQSDCVTAEPNAYRMTEFRAPTPCTLHGATVLTTSQLKALIELEQPILIDVLPAQRKPQGLEGLWLPPPRANIPNSVWLPNTGFGVLPAEEERYFRDNLKRLSDNNLDTPIVIYCESECWMSWNAAKRAAQWGYRTIYWYPGGTDVWAEAGHPLESSTPVERGSEQ